MLMRAEDRCTKSKGVACGAVAWTLSVLLLCHSAFAAASLEYLATQQNADGSFGSTPTSLATPVQTTAEVLRAYQVLNAQSEAPYLPALGSLNADTEQNTEFLSRKVLVNISAGNDANALIAQVVAHQNADGGFGDRPGYASSALDTAYALEALAAANYAAGTFVAAAVGYLLNRQTSAGGWADGDNHASVFVTAQAMRALWRYRNTYQGVTAALTGAQNFLLGQRGANGLWNESFESALALLAIIPQASDLSLVETSVTALQGEQRANGSWADDPYTTALALQAQQAYQSRKSGAAPGATGSVSGYVLRSGSSEPIAGAQVSVAERAGVSVLANGDGYFLIPNLAPGSYTLAASKSGYQPASTVAPVAAGQVTVAATLLLSIGTETALVHGKVFDAADLTALPGSTLTLSGTSTYSAVADVGGVFNIGAVAPGNYALSISQFGYQTVSGSVTIVGGQTLTINQGLVKAGGFQDPEPAPVHGTVIDAQTGTPIAGAMFDLGGGLSAVTGPDGQFTIGAVPRGNYSATLSASGYVAQSYTIAFPAGAIGNLGVLALYASSSASAPTTVTLSGTVVDGVSGAPIPGASVSLVETGAATVTDAAGRFQLSGITARAFTLTSSASGYQPRTVSVQVAAFGRAAVTLALSPPGSGALTTTLQGVVRDAQTSLPIANAQIRIGGTSLSATSDADGSYQIDGIEPLEFDVSVSAVGYAQANQGVRLAEHGQYVLDPTLQPVAATSFQVITVNANQASSAANETALFEAEIANLLDAPNAALVVGEVVDAAGTMIATLTPYAEGTTTPISLFDFAPKETKRLTLPWPTEQHAPGAYTVIVRVVTPGSINAARPRGEILAENNGYATVVATPGIAGALALDPPLTQAGSTTPVTFTALVRNAGNVALAAGNYELTVTHPDTGAVLHAVQSAAASLDVGIHASVSFGTWVPTATGDLSVRVRALSPDVPGELVDRLYVGDKASGAFTVNKTVVPEGTQTVRGQISLQGVDTRTGSSTDPLFPLVKEAVRRGGAYTAPNTTNWHRAGRCLGCHIQAQSHFGLASSLDKAEIDLASTKFLYNALSASLQADGGLRISHPQHTKVQTALGLWSLVAWPDKQASFRTKYLAAKHMHDRRNQSGNRIFWNNDHASAGWWVPQAAMTSLTTTGMVDLLRAAQQIDLTALKDYVLINQQTAGGGGAVRDLEVGPDGAIYVLKVNGVINRIDVASGLTTTVATVTGLPSSHSGFAVGADGSYYVVGDHGRLIRLAPDGSQTQLSAQSGALRDVELGPDNLLYVSDQSFHRILKFDLSGQSHGVISGGLFNRPNGIAFDPQGNLFVANNGAFNVLKVTALGAIGIFADALPYPPLALTVHDDGSLYVVHSSFVKDGQSTPFGVFRVSADGVAERLLGGPVLRAAVSQAGRVWVANESTNALNEVRTTALDTTLLAAYAADVAGAGNYFLSNFQDNTSDNAIQAMRLIGMAEAASVVTDAALKTQLNNAVVFAGNLMRARQRADGGWGRFQSQASDPLIAAMVGIALDYTDPSPNDPQIRRVIQYLLNTQAADGSWGNVSNGLTTRLGSTSFVMAYLPKALERLGGIDTDLNVTIPATIQLSNPSLAPTLVVPVAGGQQYIWELLGVTSAGRSVAFDLTLLDLQLHEERAVATRAYLEFDNSFTGEKVQVDLSVPTVRAVADLALGVSTDKANYQAHENVAISATVANTGPTTMSGQLLLAIRAQSGTVHLVELPPIAVTDLPAGAQQVYPAEWDTGATLAGAYEVYGRLLDTQGRLLRESTARFNIGAPAVNVATSVTTDKLVYDAWDTVLINGRAQNIAANAVLPPARMEITVHAPAGQALFFEARTIGELTPGALRDLAYTMPLSDAASGIYTVELVLKDDFTRTVLSTSATSFHVTRREIQAMTGTVSVQSAHVHRGDPNGCTETARNLSGADLVNVKLIHQLINADGGLVFDQFVETVNLPAGGIVHSYFRHVDTDLIGLGDFICVIKAELNGEERVLAFGGFRVVEPPIRIEATLALGAKGRLLVLLDVRDQDCPSQGDGKDRDKNDGRREDDKNGDDKHKDGGYGGKSFSGGGNHDHGHDHDDKHCHKDGDPHGPAGAPTLSDQRTFLESLLTQAGWSYTITDTADAFTHELRSGAYGAYLLVSEQEKLGEQAQKELREAVFRGEGLVLAGSHDNRHHRLNDALGLKRIGTVAHADAVNLPDGPLGQSGRIALIPGDRINRIKRLSAESLATYQLGGSSRAGDNDCRDEDDDHDYGHKDHGDPKDGDDKDRKTYGKDDDPCHGQPDTFVDAITLNNYGLGKALFAGFDLLAQATKDGADSRAAQTLLAGLNITHPAPKAALGAVVPVKLTLVNQGIATAATAQVLLPNGVQVIDAGGGQVENTPTGQTVTWSVNLALGEEKHFTFYIRLPSSEATVTVQATVTAIVGNVTRVIDEASLDLAIAPIASLDELLAQAHALSESLPAHRHALRDAAADLERAIHATHLDRAIDYAIKATDALLGITEPQVVELRRGIGAWLRYTLMLAN